MADYISTSKHGNAGSLELHSANNVIFTGEVPISSYSGHTPILQNISYLWQIVHHPDASTVRYYSPISDNELIQSLETLGVFNYTGFYSASVEIALQKYSTSDYRVISRNTNSLNPLWTEENSNFPTRLNMNGLALYIDTNAPYSYDTQPQDISGTGISFTTVGTTPEKVIKGGYPAYQFNGNGYFQCSVNPRVWDGGGDMTLILVMYAETLSTRATVFELAGGPYSSYQQSIAVTWETNSALSYYSRYSPAYDQGNTSTMGNNEWVMMAITVSSGLNAEARNGEYSKNGAAWTTNYDSNSNTALIRGNNIRIGSGYAGNMGACALGAVLLYNRELSDNEISKVFSETIQPRFGIGAAAGDPTRTTFVDLKPPLSTPLDGFLKPDGTKFYACTFSGTYDDSVYEFDLSTAWDVTSIDPNSFEHVASSLWDSGGNSYPNGVAFKSDGTKMFVMAQRSSDGEFKIYEHSLSTAWDITTYNNSNVPVATVTTSKSNNFNNLIFNDSGTKVYVVFGWNVNSTAELDEYDLSTAWDITSISSVQATLDVTDYIGASPAFYFAQSGTVLYVVGVPTNGGGVYSRAKYTLETAFDISTASYSSISNTLGSASSGNPIFAQAKTSSNNIFFVYRQTTGNLEEWTT
tara:strand:- start:219 stop:2129 length:1911 start_codon:yes stop_codon:yes gene_type:complete